MTPFAHLLRNALYPFLTGVSALLVLLFVVLLLQRLVSGIKEHRAAALRSRYRPLVTRVLAPGADAGVTRELARIPRRHLEAAGHLLLAPLGVSTGGTTVAVRSACAVLGLDREWTAALASRRWWRRAEAARALGLIEDRRATPALIRLLEDDHEEVRAAAVDALAGLGDPAALAALAPLLSSPVRHQRTRVVEALRRQGPAAVPALLAREAAVREEAVMIIELLGLIRAQAAIGPLAEWAGAESPAIRAAAFAALGSIGLDERTYYYALKGLSDASPEVRAAAARATGRARRADSEPYLAPMLDDEWLVAANAAAALRQLGSSGIVALQRRAGEEGQAGDLARQMLWERRMLAPGRA